MSKTEDVLVNQLQTLNSLVRALLTVNLETLKLKQSDKVRLLYSSGLPLQEIVKILGVTPNNVAVTLHNLRKTKVGSKCLEESEGLDEGPRRKLIN